MSFDLSKYEDVNSRIKRFRSEFPSGRLEAIIEDIDISKGYILVKALAYREYEDHVPAAVDYAFEIRSDRGVNLNFWIENAVTSAYGRVIGLLSPSDQRSTKQDMEKVERVEKWGAPVISEDQTLASSMVEFGSNLGLAQPEEAPTCPHGHRLLRKGVSEKTGKEFYGYVCVEIVRERQCEAIWYVKNIKTGEWTSSK
jgi:hypothetical protein